LRKLLIGGVALATAVGLGGGAAPAAQTEGVTLNARLAPAKAGTPQRPRNSRLTFSVAVNLPTATVGQIKLRWPATLRMSARGFTRCDFDELVATGPTACPRGSSAGPRGTAAAAVGPARAPLNFQVFPFVEDANTLLFYLNQTGGGVQTVLRGEIRGRVLTITIPQELRMPGGLDATLTSINQQFSGRAGRNFLVSSTGCRGGEHTLSASLIFSARVDAAPVPPTSTSTVGLRCRR
jgi:hypothetical protein